MSIKKGIMRAMTYVESRPLPPMGRCGWMGGWVRTPYQSKFCTPHLQNSRSKIWAGILSAWLDSGGARNRDGPNLSIGVHDFGGYHCGLLTFF